MSFLWPHKLSEKQVGVLIRRRFFVSGVVFVAALGVALFALSSKRIDDGAPLDCSTGATEEKIQCWSDSVAAVSKTQGIDEGLEALTLYAENSHGEGFSQVCHSLAHTIGEEAYRQFAAGKIFPLTDKSGYCDFGFYHGFMETLFAATGSSIGARAFCDFVATQPATRLPGVALQCYHGIGHGAVEAHDPRARGDARAILAPAKKICSEISETDEEMQNCLSGVFNGIGNSYVSGGYGLSPDPADPLWICREQPEEHKSVCYGLLARVLYALSQSNAVQAMREVPGYVEQAHRVTVVENIVTMDAARFSEQQEHGQAMGAVCAAFDATMREACIRGYVTGLIQTGSPGKEGERAIDFCRDSLTVHGDRHRCFKEFMKYFSATHNEEESRWMCSTMIPKDYRLSLSCV